MITVTIFKDHEDRFRGFHCSGHAGYSESGQDIVCSAASVLIINTVNALQMYTPDKKFSIKTSEKDGIIDVKFDHPLSETGDVLVKTMVLGLESIQDEYNDQYIHVIFK